MNTTTVLVSGAAGFIGTDLCNRLASGNEVIGIDITGPADEALNIAWEQADLTDRNSVTGICKKYSPDVVVHCAGIAHQKIGAVGLDTYIRVNSEATENLAKAAAKFNPDVRFIFLSSVSVYGEGRREDGEGRTEDGDCRPSSDYAVSKLDAERRLIALSDEGKLHDLVILRLAPVYDLEWSLNLDRRVFAPGKLAYLKFGSGSQRMSALARPNLVEFIVHILQSADYLTQRRKDAKVKNSTEITQRRKGAKRGRISTDYVDKNNLCNQRNLRINVCDTDPYEFNTIIKVFKKSGIRPNRPVISVPLSVVWFAMRIAGIFFSNKKEWIHSCYDKLASDLVFENGMMMGTGFRPRCSLETIFDLQQTHAKARQKDGRQAQRR